MPVNIVAAEKIRKAAELESVPHSTTTNPKSDGLSQLLGADNPGRLSAMGRGMSMKKLSLFQVNRPNSYKVLVETAIKPDAFLWRPTTNILNMEQAVGEMLAWPDDNCILQEDNAPKSPNTAFANKCTLLNWRGNEEVAVDEGRWQSKESDALVNGLPIGPNAVKVLVDVVLKPETFLWRPTTEISIIEDCLKTFVAWPASRVVFETTTDESPLSKSQIPTPNMQTVSSHNQISEATPSAPVKKAKNVIDSPVRRSPRKKKESVSKENQKCKLLDITVKKRVVAEGHWSSNNPDQVVYCAPLGPNAVHVWIDVVKVNDVAV
ncbi:PREDICTED: uncharacterized protein LOC109129930 [Camelina sativa]|uniref:Uncharacterized protein LOC109129930 n=1 Tax=Camelina sativa TaxID=90675 RepID=A0ABM1R683_CAMSA|nr:PREDICTED: uncharacterized protein LOC109129930 [Camelina sativa]